MGLLNELWTKYGVWGVVGLLIIVIIVWWVIHRLASPGSKVSLLGLFSYNKSSESRHSQEKEDIGPEDSTSIVSVQFDTMTNQPKVSTRLADSLTPDKILSEYNNANPLKRDQIVLSYKGIKVSWKGKLLDLKRETELLKTGDAQIISVLVKTSDKSMKTYVRFKIKSEEYLGLELLQQGHEVEFTGEIDNIDSLLVSLSNASMQY